MTFNKKKSCVNSFEVNASFQQHSSNYLINVSHSPNARLLFLCVLIWRISDTIREQRSEIMKFLILNTSLECESSKTGPTKSEHLWGGACELSFLTVSHFNFFCWIWCIAVNVLVLYFFSSLFCQCFWFPLVCPKLIDVVLVPAQHYCLLYYL